MKDLTGRSKSSSVGSGRRSGRRIDDDDLRWPTRETAAVAAQQSFWRRVTRWRGGRRLGGDAWDGEGAREWLWSRRCTAALSDVFGSMLEREQRRGKAREESEGVRGWRVASSRDVRASRQRGGGRARACAPRAHALVPTGTRLKTGEELGWASYSVGPHSWAAGKPGKFLLSLFYFLFSIFL